MCELQHSRGGLRFFARCTFSPFFSLTALLALPLFSCTSIQEARQPLDPIIKESAPFPLEQESTTSTEPTISPDFSNAQESSPPSLEDRMNSSRMTNTGSTPLSMGPLYSFRAQKLPLIDALALFARSNKLNMVTVPDIEGEITVDFHDLPLDRAMTALLDAHGYYWEGDENLITVRRLETRDFNLDYIRLDRGGSGRNRAQLTSGSSGSGPHGVSAAQEAGEITVKQEVEIKFWEEVETQVKSLMSQEGRLVINRLSGIIQITDRRPRIKEIANFLSKVRRALYRQVEIQVRIYEVNLSDEYSLGIDWTKIEFEGSDGNLAISNIITAPFGGLVPKTATTALSFNSGSFSAVLKALREQGELEVVSQPRVVTLNNQPALIKVATDQAFFTQTIAQGAAGTGNIITEQVRSVTVGLVLSVTPQVSEDGWIMLDVTPIISRLRRIVVSPNQTATAPVLDVKQSSGLVRLGDGQMVLIAGLIQDEYSETERKVPILGDIPWLGRLFKGTYTAKQKSELVIFLSPRIIEPRP